MMEDIEQHKTETLYDLLRDNGKVFHEEFLEYPTFDQVTFYLSLEKNDRKKLYALLTPLEMSEIFDVVENEVDDIEPYLLEMDRQYSVSMLLSMSKDDVVDILKKLSKDNAQKFLKLLPREEVADIMTLFQYADGTAGSLMTTEYIAISATQTVHEALNDIKKQAKEVEIINYAYVVDRYDHLVGIVSLRDLLANDGDVLIPDIMIDKIVSVTADENQSTVSQLIQDYDLVAIPVLSVKGVLLGIITVDDIIDVMNNNAVSDYSGLAGVDVEELPRTVFQSALQRLPWLVALMLLAMFTSTFISQYKNLLEVNTLLSVFITLITGTAGNAGTQSLAVTVRRLAIKEEISVTKFILDELLVGCITGTLTGLIVLISVAVLQQNIMVGGIVGVSMFASIVVSTLAGQLIPLGIVKFGIDPAIASGPFISTLSDLTSVVIYFGIANMMLQYVVMR